MTKNSVIDYFSCILVKLFGPLIRILPLGLGLFLGRGLGDLLYYFDLKHKAIAYANIKTALSDKLSPLELSRLTRESYRAFGQNFLEVFFIPIVNKEYLNKYVAIEGADYIQEGFKKGKGIIFLGIHEGSWELYNVISANLGFPFFLFVRQQRYPRLNNLLNSYRLQKGCRIIPRQNGLRQLIRLLGSNQSIGMTLDQGGKKGMQVKFFNKDASMASGAVRLALDYGAALIPTFTTRIKGPYIKLFIEPPFEIKKSGNLEKDITDNLQALVQIFQRYILKYPKEYLWSYRIWKYGKEKNILILSDAKTGHLRQSQALADIASGYLKEKGIKTKVDIVEVKFKNKFAESALTSSSCLAGKYYCQGCLWCLKAFLKEEVYKTLMRLKPDIVISCGFSVAAVNYVVARENLAKSLVIMRPALLGRRRFDLVIMPRHDKPPRGKNVAVTAGALNLIDEQYLKDKSERLTESSALRRPLSDFSIGLLIGGDTKNFHLEKEIIAEVIRQVKSVSEKFNADILITTSRRTSREIEGLIKEEFQDYPRAKLLIIANEKNIPQGLGGILGLSQVIIASPESISMISEAVSSKRYVLVFKSGGVSKKHLRFLDYFAKNKYIYLTQARGLSRAIEDIWQDKPPTQAPQDNLLVKEAIKKIL